jgi:pyruvate formate lyase activating enzyme
MEASEVIAEVRKDSVFHNRSGGGLTVTGGEPLSQPGFTLELLSLARRQRLNSAMETSGLAPYETLREVATRLDSLYYDIKIIDPAQHKAFTGVDNAMILEGLASLYREFPGLPITVRTPVVPGFNHDLEAARQIGHYLRQMPKAGFEALPYHSLGRQKYSYLGRDYLVGLGSLKDSDLGDFRQEVLEARLSGPGQGASLAK